MSFLLRMRFLFLVFCPFLVFSQEYGYTRYDSKEGLAGSTVYCMAQDKDGFLWFGTETGLSRFDGAHFKNFTREDGLPDNEIIKLFADSKGRVWIAPFRKNICYYYKGKFYNQNNDPLLESIRITSNVVRFAEDNHGNVLMQEVSCLHLVTAEGRVQTFDKIGSEPITYLTSISRNPAGGFWVMEKNRVFEFNDNRFVLRKTPVVYSIHFNLTSLSEKRLLYRGAQERIVSLSLLTDKEVFLPQEKGTVNFFHIDDIHVIYCNRIGATMYNLENPDSIHHFLPGVSVTSAMKDREGGIWFTTAGQGVYRLNSVSLLNIKIIKNSGPAHPVYSFEKFKDWVLVTSDMNLIYRLNPVTGLPYKENIVSEDHGIDPILAIGTYEQNKLILGTNFMILKLSARYKIENKIVHVAVKDICPYKENQFLVATSDHVFILDASTFDKTKVIWNERATSVFASNDTIYIGTLYGLYMYLPDKYIVYAGEKIPLLRTRIGHIRKDADQVIWIATYGEGIIAYKNGKVVAHITRRNGLTSNICRTLFVNGNTIWVGTDKGLNKIVRDKTGYSIRKFTTGDGLNSDIINAVYNEGRMVFVGTPEGVTVFDEQKINSESRCDLLFTDIAIGGRTIYPDSFPAVIPHSQNNLQFNYAGISYKSAGDIRYRYRLLGLDSTWQETRETLLSYPTLPSGDYELQVQAINKFDVNSKVISARFTIEKIVWERTWFRLLVAFIFLAFTGLLIWFIVNRIRKREQEKTAVTRRIGELEQLARKAQMNPHFIFNSLNSIQQYVMDADVAGANKFISGFSRLIRQTLDFSSKSQISLAEELDYLSNYLELEKTRLENAFTWEVNIAPDVNMAEYYIPPMILQPFVENSVRHGLRFRKDKEGKVTINIQKQDDSLICVLEDNGIGRKAALRYKSGNPIEYQSKGMTLTAERIAMFNKDHPNKISMQIDDMEDDQQKPLGTRVTLSFPIL
jgi:hypothetical protein